MKIAPPEFTTSDAIIGRLFSPLLRVLSDDSAAALVEFTVVAPLLVIMGVYTADFGIQIYNRVEIQNVAQAGAHWAMTNRNYNLSAIQNAATSATNGTGSNCGAVTVTPTPFCGCSVNASGSAIVTSWNGVCAPGSTCNSSGVIGSYITVQASTTCSSIASYGFFSNGRYTSSSNVTVRIQ